MAGWRQKASHSGGQFWLRAILLEASLAGASFAEGKLCWSPALMEASFDGGQFLWRPILLDPALMEGNFARNPLFQMQWLILPFRSPVFLLASCSLGDFFQVITVISFIIRKIALNDHRNNLGLPGIISGCALYQGTNGSLWKNREKCGTIAFLKRATWTRFNAAFKKIASCLLNFFLKRHSHGFCLSWTLLQKGITQTFVAIGIKKDNIALWYTLFIYD